MRTALTAILAMTLLPGLAGCGGGSSTTAGGEATVTVAGAAFEVRGVSLTFEAGADGYFRIEGNDAAHPDEECLPGLGGGLALYGDLPAGVSALADLAGKESPFEFTGDGDDFNLCFVGTNGLLGVDRGTVRFTAVDGGRVGFSFAGTFVLYSGDGSSEKPGISASGSGVAVAAR